jgi:hypothetical protein
VAAARGSSAKAGRSGVACLDSSGGAHCFGPATSGVASDRGAVGTWWHLYRRARGRRELPTTANRGVTHDHNVAEEKPEKIVEVGNPIWNTFRY